MDSGAVSNKTKRFLAILCHHLEVYNHIICHTAHKDLLAFKEAGMARLEVHVEIEKGLEEKVQVSVQSTGEEVSSGQSLRSRGWEGAREKT